MNPGIIFRLVVFVAAITLLGAMIAWTAHTSWRQTGDLQEQLSAKQWKSFQIADHLQQTILSLNNRMLRYAAYRNDVDWVNFQAESQELGDWLNAQQPILSSERERPYLDRINAAYQDYLAAAAALNKKIYATKQSITRVVEFTDLETQSKRILNLGIQLSQAHQQSIDLLQAQNVRSLNVLRFEMLGALACLLVAGLWLSMVVYRDMIAPLQVQLVESRQLMERQEKLASLGMLAAGVAHEIRNPLTAIKAWLYLQQKQLVAGTPQFAEADLIGEEINRLERIVRDFLQFARPSDPQLTVVSAEHLLLGVQLLLQPEFDKTSIKLKLGEIVPAQVRVDPQQIRQVLINLIHNAADSIRGPGTVTLRARTSEKWLQNHHTRVVILEIIDTGKGIAAEVEKRLFDPFFTTKETGTGLGLPIAARIVEKHQGALQYQTQVDSGTTFGIILPLHKP